MYVRLFQLSCTISHLHVLLDKLFLGNLGAGGVLSIIFWTQYISAMSISQLCSIFELWWLGHWATQYTLQDHGSVRVS